jgi:arylsulfatase A-like enzyme
MRFVRVVSRLIPVTLLTLSLASCSGPSSDAAVLTAEMPLHLEEHLDAATLVGSDVPADVPAAVEWRFDEPQPDWKPVPPREEARPIHMERTEQGLRLTLNESNNLEMSWSDGEPQGGIYVELPDWKREDWAYVMVRARASEDVQVIWLGFNLRGNAEEDATWQWPWAFAGERIDVVNDGSVQTYLLRADWTAGVWEGPWRQLGLWIDAKDSATVDLLSVSVIPKEANYASEAVGVREEVIDRSYRRSIYTHAPSRLAYQVRVPTDGRLDVGLGVLRDDIPVTFRVAAELADGATELLLEESHGDKERWAERTVDLSSHSGETLTLALETDAEKPGTVALWAAPTLSGEPEAARPPNVVFYVIDGAGADFMSVYGYNRRTTPNLERLAAEGALFEQVYSNSSWTYPSTASFMTSLQNSVLGGQREWRQPVPDEAVTMAMHFQGAGYQTGVFVANPNAGTLSGLQRGVDVFQEDWPQFAYFGGPNYKESSKYLHEGFWRWREAYPGSPWWVHFQTTDVHEDFPAVPPFAGLFVGPAERETWREWNERLGEEGDHGVYSEAYEKTGLSRVDFFALHQGLYDETMAHNDYQIGRLVERLKAEGEWENTLLIIAADHSTDAAMDDMGLAMQDSLPPRWVSALFRPSISRVPLIFVWPGHIEGGQRFSQPVSNIDILPTVLDLAGLPQPDVRQGQSLAPLLLGTGQIEPRPVILDELWLSDAGEVQAMIEVVDGRWGASLRIGPEEEEEERRRPTPLLLFDLWNDHWCVRPVNEEHPELVEKYTEFLEGQWQAHQDLAQLFTRRGEVELTAEQLQTLRALGYIQ